MDMSNHPLLSLHEDPPPFPLNQPLFTRLDRSVVCQICKDIFSGPVSIACGHSFCSECIRSSLDVMKEKKCPACDVPVTEGSIRRNRALEEITDAWDAARPMLINMCNNTAGPSRRRPALDAASKVSSNSSLNGKRRRSASASRSQSPVKGKANQEVDLDDVDDAGEELSENDIGPCPICSANMPISSIPMHIERGCPPPKQARKINGSGNQKADWKRVFAGAGLGKEKHVEMKRILKPNYAIATPADLRTALTEYDLPTTGDKPTLQNRLQQWIILFNSNLDTSHPRSLSALRAKLSEIELAKKKDKDKGRDEAISELGTKEGMVKYAKEKRGEFERLRDEIKRRDGERKRKEEGIGKESAIEVD